MTILSNNILSYYQNHALELPSDKQFHLASRLYLWNQDETASQALQSLRNEFTSSNNPEAALRAVMATALESPVHGSKNAAELRRPYFERYPKLKVYVSVLFRMHFMRLIYNLDSRPLFHQLFDESELLQLRNDLLNDSEALAILSTHAINFLYLYDRSFTKDNQLPLETFLQVGRNHYDLNDRMHLQLFIYFYTHCILGESLFYYRHIPTDLQQTYLTMLQELEQLIVDHYDDINLDNKCEFLVCAKVLGVASRLEPLIFAEAEQSVSDEGTFIVDRHNNNPQTNNVALDSSEHRNVLFMMANLDFTPLG